MEMATWFVCLGSIQDFEGTIGIHITSNHCRRYSSFVGRPDAVRKGRRGFCTHVIWSSTVQKERWWACCFHDQFLGRPDAVRTGRRGSCTHVIWSSTVQKERWTCCFHDQFPTIRCNWSKATWNIQVANLFCCNHGGHIQRFSMQFQRWQYDNWWSARSLYKTIWWRNSDQDEATTFPIYLSSMTFLNAVKLSSSTAHHRFKGLRMWRRQRET